MAKKKKAVAKAGRKTAKKGRPAAKAARKAAKKPARKAMKKAAKKAPRRKTAAPKARKAAARKTPSRKATASKGPARKAPSRKAPAAKGARKGLPKAASAPAKAAKPAKAATNRAARPAPIRGAIPSSLGLAGGASAARSGRDELLQNIKQRTETSPAITAGDVDADWQLGYSSGDEAPGGDNPTPDQDVVDEIGEALGVEYDDEEELKGAAKIEDRDKHRWELNPDSKDEFDE